MIPEAKLEQQKGGLAPRGEGWFVVNAREAQWFDHPIFGRYTRFEGDVRFPEVGINISLLEPGNASCARSGSSTSRSTSGTGRATRSSSTASRGGTTCRAPG